MVLTPQRKIKIYPTSRINNLHVATKTIKFSGENAGVTLHKFGFGNVFLNRIPKAEA